MKKHYEAWFKIFPDRDAIQLVYFGKSKRDCFKAATEASLDYGCIPVIIAEDGTGRWEAKGLSIINHVVNGGA